MDFTTDVSDLWSLFHFASPNDLMASEAAVKSGAHGPDLVTWRDTKTLVID